MPGGRVTRRGQRGAAWERGDPRRANGRVGAGCGTSVRPQRPTAASDTDRARARPGARIHACRLRGGHAGYRRRARTGRSHLAMTGPLRRAVGRAIRAEQAPATPDEIERLLLAVGRTESRAVREGKYEGIADAEFRIFSQFGEDGIIQFLISRVPIEHDTFIEFGVADYRESNTRFLVCNDNWRGLIMDGGTSHIDFVHNNPIGWRHHVDARS